MVPCPCERFVHISSQEQWSNYSSYRKPQKILIICINFLRSTLYNKLLLHFFILKHSTWLGLCEVAVIVCTAILGVIFHSFSHSGPLLKNNIIRENDFNMTKVSVVVSTIKKHSLKRWQLWEIYYSLKWLLHGTIYWNLVFIMSANKNVPHWQH